MEFDNFAGDYDRLLQENLEKYGKDISYYAEYKVALTQRYAENKTPRSILDFGCGIGRSCPYLHRFFPKSELWGTDTSQASLKVAQKNNPYCFFFPVEEAPPRNFDIVLATGVFHHIPLKNRLPVLRTITSWMNPEAELFIFEHNPYNPLTRHAVNTCPFDKDAELITLSDMKRLIFRSGLTILPARYTLFFPAALKPLRFLEPLLAPLPLGGQYMVHARHDVGRAG